MDESNTVSEAFHLCQDEKDVLFSKRRMWSFCHESLQILFRPGKYHVKFTILSPRGEMRCDMWMWVFGHFLQRSRFSVEIVPGSRTLLKKYLERKKAVSCGRESVVTAVNADFEDFAKAPLPNPILGVI